MNTAPLPTGLSVVKHGIPGQWENMLHLTKYVEALVILPFDVVIVSTFSDSGGLLTHIFQGCFTFMICLVPVKESWELGVAPIDE